LHDFKGTAFLGIDSLLLVLHLALLLEFILLDRNIELSENIRMAKNEPLKNLGLSIGVFDADLRNNGLGLEGEEALGVSTDILACGLLRLVGVAILLILDDGSPICRRLAEAQLFVIKIAGRWFHLKT
jgi:hypothetical protein